MAKPRAPKIAGAAETKPKPFVFVLMPFDPKFDDVFELGISAACKEAGAYCERVDQQIFSESILDRIYNQISKADIVVADMTGRNANVYYETGYAHALGKKTILLTQEANDIPFDLKHFPHIVYGGKIADLKTALKARARYFLEHPDKQRAPDTSCLELYLNRNKLESNGTYKMSLKEHTREHGWHISLDMHNPTDSVFDATSMQIGLTFGEEFASPSYREDTRCIKIIDNKNLLLKSIDSKIFPQGWHHEGFNIASRVTRASDREFDCALRFFTEMGMREIPFKFAVVA